MTDLTLKVSKREVRGTGKLNALRAQGYMPGVVYGPAVKENINIQVLRERYADEHADGIIGWFEFDSKVEDAQKLAALKMASN